MYKKFGGDVPKAIVDEIMSTYINKVGGSNKWKELEDTFGAQNSSLLQSFKMKGQEQAVNLPSGSTLSPGLDLTKIRDPRQQSEDPGWLSFKMLSDILSGKGSSGNFPEKMINSPTLIGGAGGSSAPVYNTTVNIKDSNVDKSSIGTLSTAINTTLNNSTSTALMNAKTKGNGVPWYQI